MSLGLCPVCEPALDDARMPDGTALLQALDVLDELSAALGVRALSSYGDTRELPADFDGDPDEALELLGPRTDWHAINDGLASCETLLQSLARHPQADLDNAWPGLPPRAGGFDWNWSDAAKLVGAQYGLGAVLSSTADMGYSI
jgi:hypothetical protein